MDANGNFILDSCEPVCIPPNCGACCFGPDQCTFTTQADCTGTYLGDGVNCNAQATIVPIHTATQWSHEISVETDCPDPGARSGGPGCVKGPEFIDPWVTEDTCTSCEDFSSPDACPIPADFFGPGSDQFAGVICFIGDPLGMVTIPGFGGPLDFGTADTLVRRVNDPFDRCDLPSATPVVVNIVMEQLSLVSCAPMTVTFNGGQNPESWDVRIQVLDSTGQPGGTLTATKTHCNGGTFDSSFTVCPKFIFTKVDPPFTQFELDFCVNCNPAGITMTTNGVDWVNDVDASLALVSPVCTGFHPSLSQSNPSTECDCNGNLIRDNCDIESGLSGDCNNNLTPDECDIASQISEDVNANGVPDECDDLPISAASDFGLISLTLLLLMAATIMLRHRRSPCES